MDQHTEPDEATKDAEQAEAKQSHTADRPATDEERAAAERDYEQSDEEERRKVAEHERETNEIGAAAKGEGAIE